MPQESKELLKLIARGDTIAFRQLFDAWYPKVKVFLAEYTMDDEDARDLAQNIFVKIWAARAGFPEIRSFGAYLYRMCRNAALDYCKRRHIKVELQEDFVETYPLDEDYFAREMHSLLEKRIAQMPPRRREVVTLSRIEGLSNDEIATALGINKKTVENHLNAALHDLRKLTS